MADTVSVGPGTFRESIDLRKYISLVGAGAGQTTLLPSRTTTAVVYIHEVPYTSGGQTRVTGFTIRDGDAPSGQGGGITVYNSADPIIENNTITNNRAAAYGGGILVNRNSSPVIRNNTIQNNSALRGGGGIFAFDGSNPVIFGNTIDSNTVSGASIPNGGSSGGGIYLEAPANGTIYPVVVNNQITNNTAEFAGGGIMLRTGANAMIDGNTITNNKAAYGGGIHVETEGTRVVIENNTVNNNTAAALGKFAGSGYGGGVSVYAKSPVAMANNVIKDNRASNGGGGVVVAENGVLNVDSSTLTGNALGPKTITEPAVGGGIYAANATLTVSNSVMAHNSAERGGAIAVYVNAKAGISSNTFASNQETGGDGGAIFIDAQAQSSSAGVSNNIFANNSNHQIFEPSSQLKKRNNLFQPDDSNAYLSNQAKTAADMNDGGLATGNFAGDPKFTNAGSDDYTISSSSDAIDKATTSDVPVVPADDRRNAIRDDNVDVGAFEYLASPVIKKTVFRFWSTSKRSHFYTISPDERNQVISGYSPVEWRYEGRAYDAFDTNVAGSIPLYRFYSRAFNGHFYTASAGERDLVIANYDDDTWLYEQVAYYVYPLTGGPSGTDTVYRFWSPDNRHHFYTASVAERDLVRSSYPDHVWTYEGDQFKVPR
jgi:parallel beta-helix repeat protein